MKLIVSICQSACGCETTRSRNAGPSGIVDFGAEIASRFEETRSEGGLPFRSMFGVGVPKSWSRENNR